MSDFTTTTNFSLKKPTVGQAVDLWGTYINSNFDAIDSQLQTLTVSIQTPDLEGLGNVLNTTPSTNDFLRFNGESWAAATVSIPSSIDDLSDVDTSTTAPTTGQALVWSGSSWTPSTPTAATIADASITTAKLDTGLQTQVGRILVTDDDDTPTDGQILQYSTADTEWKFADLPGSTVVTLSDVNSASLADNALLVYNSTAGEFQFESGSTLRTTLGVDVAGTDNSTDLSISSSTSYNYITLSAGQVLTLNQVDLQTDVANTLPVSSGGTGSTTAATARVALLPTLTGNGSKLVAVNSGATDVEYIAESTLSITESQISDLQSYLTAEVNDLSAAVTWANVPDVNITQSSVTQHQAALSITESQISDLQTYLTAETNDLSTAVTGTLPVANGGTGVTALSSLNAADLGSNNGVTDATNGYVLTADGTGGVAWEAATGGISDIVSDTTPQLGGNLDVNGNSIVSVSAGNISITPDTTGKVILDGLSWPTADGSADQVLKTDGAGNLSFVDQSGGGGSGSSYIEHSSTVSDSLAISAGTNRMYIGNTTFSNSGTMAGYLVISHGYANFTGASALNVTGTLNVVS